MPPKAPYQAPVYKKGLRTKPSVAPTNFAIIISSRRFSIANRMVLPIDSKTPKQSRVASPNTIFSPTAIMAFRRRTQSISISTSCTTASCSMRSFKISSCVGVVDESLGVTTMVCGSGFSSNILRTSEKPERSWKSRNAWSAGINSTASMSASCSRSLINTSIARC